MGDLSFFALLADLAGAETPLIEDSAGANRTDDRIEWWQSARLGLTEAGKAVLAGDDDHVALQRRRPLVGRHPSQRPRRVALRPDEDEPCAAAGERGIEAAMARRKPQLGRPVPIPASPDEA